MSCPRAIHLGRFLSGYRTVALEVASLRLLERGSLDFGQGQKGWNFSRVLARDVAKDQENPTGKREEGESG
jgi:hypothetical protein